MVAPNISCQLTCHSAGSLPGKAKEEKPAGRCRNANLWIFQEEQELSLPFALALMYHLSSSELSLLLEKSLPSGLILTLITVEQRPNCSNFPQPGGGGGGCRGVEF